MGWGGIFGRFLLLLEYNQISLFSILWLNSTMSSYANEGDKDFHKTFYHLALQILSSHKLSPGIC
jgi:hypothetical protein